MDQYTLKIASELTANKYEAELNLFHIPDFVPFIGDHDVIAKGELGLGTFGYKVKLGAETGDTSGKSLALEDLSNLKTKERGKLICKHLKLEN